MTGFLARHRRKIGPAVVAAAALAALAVFHRDIIAWFTPPSGRTVPAIQHDHGQTTPMAMPDGGAAMQATTGEDVSHEGHGHGGEDIAYYTCSMHTSVREQHAGKCPICGMTLSPVTYEETEEGVIFVDTVKRQRIGVKTQAVDRGPLALRIRAVGQVKYDETRLHDVTLKFAGFVERLLVDRTGQPVTKGQTLFLLYSPDLYAAQLELLSAAKSRDASDPLMQAARRKLKLWDLPDAQIDAIVRSGEPRKAVPFPSPATGYVIEKDVVDGAYVEAGKRIYRIAALDRVWVEAQVYEQELPAVRVGQEATVTLPYSRERAFAGKIAYIYPYIEGQTRTARLRVELPNRELELKPDMYADVDIAVDLGERLRVPEEAIIYTGPRRIVFVDLGQDRMRPKEVRLGFRAGGWFEVVSGLKEGEVVVTSGNFLLAAESRIRSSLDIWGKGGGDGAGGHKH